jgi:phage tail-like protein
MTSPLTAARFEISVDGHSLATFSELAGITTEGGSVDYIPSGESESVFLNRHAAVRKPISVRLVRPRGVSTGIRTWYEAAKLNPGGTRKRTAMHLCESAVKPLIRYSLENAWPSKIEIGGLRGNPSTSTMETVTMTCEFIQRVSV